VRAGLLGTVLAFAAAFGAGVYFHGSSADESGGLPAHAISSTATGMPEIPAPGSPIMQAAAQANGQAHPPQSDQDLQDDMALMLGAVPQNGRSVFDVQAWCAKQQGCARLAGCAACMQSLAKILAAAPPGSEPAQRAAALVAASGDVQAIKGLVEKIIGLSDTDAASASKLGEALAQVNNPEAAAYFASLIAGGLDSAGGRHLAELEQTLLKSMAMMDDQPLVGAYLADVYQRNTAESARERLINIKNADMLSQIALAQYQLGSYAESSRALAALYLIPDDGKGSVLAALASYGRKTGADMDALAEGFRPWSAVETNPYSLAVYVDILTSTASGFQDKVLAAAALGALADRGGAQALRKALDQGTDPATQAIAGQELQRLQARGAAGP
jgi:hypothetical protein